jgi:hypothetical protein
MQRAIQTVLVLGVVLAGASVAGAAHPNFSGEWTLNLTQSNFGGMPAPTTLTQTITHDDPTLRVVTAQTGAFSFNADFSYTTDGKECPNQLNDFKVTTVITWDGDALVLDSKMDFQGTAMTAKDKWTLSPDGRRLIVARHFSGPMGEGDAMFVMDKN